MLWGAGGRHDLGSVAVEAVHGPAVRAYTRDELEAKRAAWQLELDRLNGKKIARVAASLHPYRPRPVDGVQNKHEAPGSGVPEASTNLSPSGDPSGCSAHGTT